MHFSEADIMIYEQYSQFNSLFLTDKGNNYDMLNLECHKVFHLVPCDLLIINEIK